MTYLLTVLTNGRRDCLERTLAAFVKYVYPLPASGFLMDDGGASRNADLPGVASLDEIFAATGFDWNYTSTVTTVGACRAQAFCWREAGEANPYPWAMHLEDDYVIVRPVPVRALTTLILNFSQIEQVALIRAPWAREIEHGGYVAQAPSFYERFGWNGVGHGEPTALPSGRWRDSRPKFEWIETTRNWTNSPAVFSSALAREIPWPEENCENQMAREILARRPEAKLALWGWGEPWCAHIGIDRARGAYGY